MNEEQVAKKVDDHDAGARPEIIKLSLEERAVLIDCRRRSTVRGAISGSGFCMLLYWLQGQGRTPAFVSKYSSLVYGLTFFGAFLTGMTSYNKTCLQRLLALENSALAKRYLNTMSEIKEGTFKRHAEKKKTSPPHPLHREPPKQRPQAAPQAPNDKLDEGPAINVWSYNKDKSMLHTKVDEREQPSAFSSEKDDTSSTPPMYNDPQKSKEGRKTFDEIREENRRKQRISSTFPESAQTGSRSGTERRKKRNKYGDEIEE